MKALRLLFGAYAAWLWASSAQAQAWLDRVDDALYWQSPKGTFRSDLSLLLDLEGYYVDQRPPGLLFGEESFFNPRLSIFVDTRWGDHLYSLVQARLDRGFDPYGTNFDARVDEYLLRYQPFDDGRLNFQIGKFATVVGNWVLRHDSWQNPFVTAPVPYENVTIITDAMAPASPQGFLARRAMADVKSRWLPVLWGPAYTSGGAIFGAVGHVDYAVDLKNASISSRPAVWDAQDRQWQYPTVSGRLGHRPNPAWNYGVSFSVGPYLLDSARPSLPAGRGLGDYDQTTLGYDLSYAWHHWQLWGEVFLSRFEVPNVGNADTLAYYLEAKYKISPHWFAAGRWNQQFFGTVPNGFGGRQTWDADLSRVDLALGCRITRHLQTKLQYSYGHQDSAWQQGEQLVAAQITLKF
jgi:hypothetical protein